MPASRDYPRARRVNEVLREVLAEELERLADADERLRMLTVTSVETAADLRTATVYVDSLGPGAEAVLEERRAQLQRAVGRQVRLKRTPRLHFRPDPAVSAGARVDEILRRLERASTSGGRGRSDDPRGAQPADDPERPTR